MLKKKVHLQVHTPVSLHGWRPPHRCRGDQQTVAQEMSFHFTRFQIKVIYTFEAMETIGGGAREKTGVLHGEKNCSVQTPWQQAIDCRKLIFILELRRTKVVKPRKEPLHSFTLNLKRFSVSYRVSPRPPPHPVPSRPH